jgi:aryl-alcohol dehydrogenase-like predicted oxidoreductase
VEHRQLGATGPLVSDLGLGCVGMSDFYGAADEADSLATLRHAVEIGVRFFDTSDAYGVDGHNERLLGRALAPFRDDVVVASKFGIVHQDDGGRTVDARPERAAPACEASLRRLGFDHLDLYYAHRVDPRVPIEETVGAMAELVAAGKVRHLGLCEASATSLERAASVHPIAAVQSEWSLWSRDIEDEVLPAARRLGVGIVPFSPLGRGFLAGAVTGTHMLEPGDFRKHNPRFEDENLRHNLERFVAIERLAEVENLTPAQLALRWLLDQGNDVVPIPGTRRRSHLDDNVGATRGPLARSTRAELERLVPKDGWAGARYRPEPGTAFGGTYGDSPPLGQTAVGDRSVSTKPA